MSQKGTVQLRLNRLQHPEVPKKCTAIKFAEPVAITTEERILAIYSARPENAPQVQIWNSRFDELPFIK